jgi:hypothetical protein
LFGSALTATVARQVRTKSSTANVMFRKGFIEAQQSESIDNQQDYRSFVSLLSILTLLG